MYGTIFKLFLDFNGHIEVCKSNHRNHYALSLSMLKDG